MVLGIFFNHHGPPPQLAVNFHELDTRYHTVKIQRVCHHKVLVIHAAQHHAVQGVQHLVPPPTGQVVFTAGVVLDIAKVQRCPKDDWVPGLQLGCQFGFLGTGQITSAAAAALHSQVAFAACTIGPAKQ